MQRLTLPQEAIDTGYSISRSNMQYLLKSPTRKSSSIEVKDGDGQVVDTYIPEKELGAGRYGSVRLFTSNSDATKHLAVKQPVHDLEGVDEEPPTNKSIAGEAELMNKEVMYLAKSYPDSRPYSIKHFINANNQYDYRFIILYHRA